MKALTIRQPWAQLIALGEKTIETRTRATSHRGPLAIHAGLHPPPKCQRCNGTGMPGPEGDACDVCAGDGIDTVGDTHGEELVFGAIVAVVNVVDCVPVVRPNGMSRRLEGDDEAALEVDANGLALWRLGEHEQPEDFTDELPYGDFAPGRWAWILADVRPLPEPVPCRGAQGLWTVPADIEAAVLDQAREAVPS